MKVIESKIKLVIVAIMFVGSNAANAQSLDRSVVSNGGNNQSNSSLSMEFTIGETLVGTMSHSSAELTNGFIQVYTDTTGNISAPSFLKGQTKVFPNPSNGIFNLSSEMNGKLEVVDVTGKIIMENKVITKGLHEIDLSDQSNGMYLVRISNGTETWHQRLILNR